MQNFSLRVIKVVGQYFVLMGLSVGSLIARWDETVSVFSWIIFLSCFELTYSISVFLVLHDICFMKSLLNLMWDLFIQIFFPPHVVINLSSYTMVVKNLIYYGKYWFGYNRKFPDNIYLNLKLHVLFVLHDICSMKFLLNLIYDHKSE